VLFASTIEIDVILCSSIQMRPDVQCNMEIRFPEGRMSHDGEIAVDHTAVFPVIRRSTFTACYSPS